MLTNHFSSAGPTLVLVSGLRTRGLGHTQGCRWWREMGPGSDVFWFPVAISGYWGQTHCKHHYHHYTNYQDNKVCDEGKEETWSNSYRHRQMLNHNFAMSWNIRWGNIVITGPGPVYSRHVPASRVGGDQSISRNISVPCSVICSEFDKLLEFREMAVAMRPKISIWLLMSRVHRVNHQSQTRVSSLNVSLDHCWLCNPWFFHTFATDVRFTCNPKLFYIVLPTQNYIFV